MLIENATEPLEAEADFLIVGSGAAGATAARWLSAAGHRVIVIEEGPSPKPAEGALEALGALYRDAGASAAIGGDVLPLLQGRCVGGTTVVNGGIQVPFPEPVWREWVAMDPRWAERLPFAALEQARERMDVELGVEATPEALFGANGGGMKRGLGLLAHATRRNAPGCKGSGRCLEGCPHARKKSADRSLLPAAMTSGATVLARCRVGKIRFTSGRATGLRARFDSGARVDLRARRAVIVAAGAIQSSALLLASGVSRAGRGFTCHPGAAMAGLFSHPVFGSPEATQSMESLAFLDRGFKLESLGMPKAFRAARVPGFGHTLAARLEQLDNVALWGTAVRAKARGRIVRGPLGPLVLYTPTKQDRAVMLAGLSVLAEAMLEAGAKELWPAVHGSPERIDSKAGARSLANLPPTAGTIPMVATHLFGGIEVDDRFQAFGIPGLVAADSGIFATNLGVNPMSAICAVSTVIAGRWS